MRTESLGEPWIHPMDRLAGVDKAEPSELLVGDVVIWDERCTAHFAVRDPWEGERVLRRLLVEGDCPVAAE